MNGIPARLELSRADGLVFVALVFFATLPRGRSTCRALDLGGLIGLRRLLFPLAGAITVARGVVARGTPLLVLVLAFDAVVLVVFLIPRLALLAVLFRPLRRRPTLIFRDVVLVVVFGVSRFRRLVDVFLAPATATPAPSI